MAVPKKVTKTTKAAPVKKSTEKKESNVLTAEQFVKRFKKSNSIIKRSGKKEAPSGFSKPEEIIEKYELKPGKGVTCKARLNNVRLKLVNESVVMSFNFTDISGKNKGTPLQNDIWLNEEDEESLEKAMDSIVFLLQKLGYETDDLDIEKLAQLAEELTELKPCCILYINCYKHKGGKNKGKLNYGLRVNSPYDPEADDANNEDDPKDSEDEDGDDQEVEDDPSEEEDGDDSADGEESDSEDEDDDDTEDEDEEEEDDDTSNSDEEDEEDFDADDPTTWIGYVCKVKPAGVKTAKEYAVTAYSSKTKKLTIKGKDGKSIAIKPEEVIDWVSE